MPLASLRLSRRGRRHSPGTLEIQPTINLFGFSWAVTLSQIVHSNAKTMRVSLWMPHRMDSTPQEAPTCWTWWQRSPLRANKPAWEGEKKRRRSKTDCLTSSPFSQILSTLTLSSNAARQNSFATKPSWLLGKDHQMITDDWWLKKLVFQFQVSSFWPHAGPEHEGSPDGWGGHLGCKPWHLQANAGVHIHWAGDHSHVLKISKLVHHNRWEMRITMQNFSTLETNMNSRTWWMFLLIIMWLDFNNCELPSNSNIRWSCALRSSALKSPLAQLQTSYSWLTDTALLT